MGAAFLDQRGDGGGGDAHASQASLLLVRWLRSFEQAAECVDELRAAETRGHFGGDATHGVGGAGDAVALLLGEESHALPLMMRFKARRMLRFGV
jgi:hypothetical protein